MRKSLAALMTAVACHADYDQTIKSLQLRVTSLEHLVDQLYTFRTRVFSVERAVALLQEAQEAERRSQVHPTAHGRPG